MDLLELFARSSSVQEVASTASCSRSPRWAGPFVVPGDSRLTTSFRRSQHRSKVQVVDARTFNERQILEVPCSSSAPSPPPRPRPPTVRSPRAFVDSLYAERISPEERFMRRLLQDVGSTTEERSRSRGDRGWRYMNEDQDREGEGDEDEESDEGEDDEDGGRMLARMEEADLGPLRRAVEEDCPPEAASTSAPSSSSSSGPGSYSRILPDPRARRTTRDPRTFHPQAGDLPPFHLSSTTSGQPIGARILSGYSPLAAYGIPDGREWRSEGLGPAYQATSLYFPADSTPSDLLGLDWDEEGTSLFVATENRVTEWEVDTTARRSFGEWGMR